MSTHDILHRLSDTLASRRNADPEKSYTAKLFSEGPDSMERVMGGVMDSVRHQKLTSPMPPGSSPLMSVAPEFMIRL